MIWISEWLTLGLAFTVAAACVGRRELMAGEVSPVHLPRSLSSGSRFLLVAGQCEMIVSCLSSYSSFDFFNGVCCRQVKPLRTSLLLFSTTLITIPSDHQWQEVLRVLKGEKLRNQVMLLLAYDGALRREELVRLSISDFDFAYRQIHVRAEHAKNGSERVVGYSSVTSHFLEAYLQQRRQLSTEQGALFRSESRRNPGSPLSLILWSKVVESLAERAGVPRFTTHTPRHLRLTHLARAHMDLHQIATYARHRSLQTTMLYLHLSGVELTEAVSRSLAGFEQWMAYILEGSRL